MDQRLYKEIENYIMEIILANISLPDFKLPSERWLSLKFNASREPVQHAYNNLIQKGFVTKKHGLGYYISNCANEKVGNTAALQNPKISLIISDVSTHYTHSILTGINHFCTEHNLELSILLSNSSPEKENELITFAYQSGSKGIILFPVNYDYAYNDELSNLTGKKYPLVLIDRTLPVRASFVTSENHQAMIDAVEFLQRKGFQKPVYISPPPEIASTTDSRINGFTHGLLRYYKMMEPRNILIAEGSPTEIKNTVIRYLKKYTDTDVIIVLGTMCPAIVMATNELGIQIPRDLKLMVFDDEMPFSQKNALKPYIIEQDGCGIGYYAAQALYNQLYGDSQPVTQMLPVTIIDTSEEKTQ